MAEVDKKKQKTQSQLSFKMWKHINPGYTVDKLSTTNKDCFDYNPEDYKDIDREYAHKRDKHTQYVEYLIRDQHLKRGAASAPK